MSAFLPVPGSFVTHIGRFIDESAGVAMGWVYAYRIFTAADCTALAGLWSYWFPDINPGVWVACTLGVVFVLNCLAVKYFGEVEFYASIFKIFLIFGFLLFTFVVVLGGNPKHDRIGFRYWRDSGAFNETYTTGTTGRFLSIWGVFNTAAFAIGGPDFIANCASEAVNPRRNIPKAVRRVIYRLIFFFILSVFAVGLLVPYNDPTMRVPIPALVLSTAVASLAFMTCNTASAVVLNWFINLGSTAIMIAYILMMQVNTFQAYSNYFAIFWVGIILLTNGYGKSRPDDL
ncbi:hypothetical protein COL940_010295 [Colletotrichum noveboracense]|nr:hypothetical protein COL940_010295 [Colletotrichum noveboracense]